MSTSRTLAIAAVTIAVVGLTVPAAQATTEHCDAENYPNKVEVSGDRTSVYTGLAPGTTVCIKASTRTTIVTVDADGRITQSAIRNQNGKAQAISYYAYGNDQPI